MGDGYEDNVWCDRCHEYDCRGYVTGTCDGEDLDEWRGPVEGEESEGEEPEDSGERDDYVGDAFCDG